MFNELIQSQPFHEDLVTSLCFIKDKDTARSFCCPKESNFQEHIRDGILTWSPNHCVEVHVSSKDRQDMPSKKTSHDSGWLKGTFHVI